MASSEIKLKKLSNDEVLTTSHLRDIKAAIKEEMRMRSGNGSLFGYYEDIGGELKIDGYSIDNLQKWTDYDGYFGHTDANESFNGNIFPTQAQYQASLGYLQDSKLNSGSIQKGSITPNNTMLSKTIYNQAIDKLVSLNNKGYVGFE